MKFLKITLLFPLLCALLNGHPIPDIPVIGKFNSNGNSSIYIEIDTRSFAEDPEQVPFLTNSAFKQLSDSNKTDLILQAKSMIENALQLRFGNNDWYLPEFIFDFVERDGGDLSEENIFVLQGQYDISLDNNSSFYQIRSQDEAPYDLVFTNQINGKPQRRVNVLFPNEESFKFDLSFIDGKPIAFKTKLSKNQVPLQRKVRKSVRKMPEAPFTLLPGKDLFMFSLLVLITSYSYSGSFFFQENGSRFYTKSPYLRLLTQ